MEYLHNGYTLELCPGAFPLSTDSIALGGFVKLPRQAKVLDLGSGCGTLGLLLCANDPGFTVTGIEVDENATYTGFTDEIPSWLRPYLAAALRSGITAGWPYGEVFGANQPINGMEAALLTQNALDLTVSTVAGKDEDGALPSWAVTAITTLADNGLEVTTEILTRAQTAKLVYQIHGLAPTAPGMQIY